MVADRPVAVRARGLRGVQALLLEPFLAHLGQVGDAGDGLVLAQLVFSAHRSFGPVSATAPAPGRSARPPAGSWPAPLADSVLVGGIAAVEVRDHQIRRLVVVHEMPVHPFVVDARAGNGGIDRLLDLPAERAGRADRRRLLRRVEDGQRQQPQVDADGGEQRDQVAARDRLAAVGVADRLPAAGEHVGQRGSRRRRRCCATGS